MGSKSDWETMAPAAEVLARFGVAHECRVVSAHRTPDWLREKKIHLIVQHTKVRHPELPDVPAIVDLGQDDAQRRILALYAGGIADFRAGTLREDIAARLGQSPPTFIVHAFDDAAHFHATNPELWIEREVYRLMADFTADYLR